MGRRNPTYAVEIGLIAALAVLALMGVLEHIGAVP